MRIRSFGANFIGSALTVCALALPAALGAQAAGSFSSGTGSASPRAVRSPQAPYTVTRKTTRVQTLADGTTITHVTTIRMARDSSGRNVNEAHQALITDASNSEREIVTVNINDPVNRTHTFWDSRSNQAILDHLQELRKTVEPRTGPQHEVPAPLSRADETPLPPIERHSEDLGTRTFFGVTAQGHRFTRTLPAGREGNDRPVIITDERWFAPNLPFALLEIRDDPRTGKVTEEVTDLQFGEPDPALFQIPEGYTVKEHYPDQQN